MGEFSAKEIEITDYIVEHINNEIFCNEQDAIDKSRLEYSLCSNEAERLQVTKERVAKYKSKIDKCDPDIAGYMSELVRHNPKEIDDGELRDWLTRNFVIYHYQELIEELAPIGKVEIEDYVFSSIVKSKGHSYKKIKNYIDGVCNIIHYTKYKYFLEIKVEEKEELAKQEITTILSAEEITEATIYKEIIRIINHPFSDELHENNNDFKGYDDDGAPIYIENDNPEIYNVEKDINEPFERLESLITQLMEVSKHSIVLEGYLKKIFKEFIENFVIVLELYDNEISIKNKGKYPKNLTYYYYVVRYRYCRFYDFIIEFLDDKFLVVENKVIVDDLRYLIKGNKSVENNLSINEKQANPYPQVFSNLKSFQLFEKLFNQFKDSSNKLADFSFIYRKMFGDKYILNHFKPQMFIEWVNKEPFKISLDKIKTLNDCSTSQKVNTYATTKELIQIN